MSASEKISKEVQMTRDTLHYVKDARLKYKEDLCQKRQEEENERNSLKRKIVDHETKQQSIAPFKVRLKILQLVLIN